jgi:arsenite methyltransferase
MVADYLDMQARLGISKHLGGRVSSRLLLEACNVAEAREVLDVGCGVGIEPMRIARSTQAHVVGLDRSERMLGWADRRAREARVRDRIELVPGDACRLPFTSDRFDVVVCESVLMFVEDREVAIREMVRVTRPGGFVGINEGFHRVAAPSDKARELTRSMAGELLPLEAWKRLWADSGLEDRTIRTFGLDAGRELRDRLRWMGLAWTLRAIGRGILLYATDPEVRAFVNLMGRAVAEPADDAGSGDPQPVWVALQYGLFTGRKPLAVGQPAAAPGRSA